MPGDGKRRQRERLPLPTASEAAFEKLLATFGAPDHVRDVTLPVDEGSVARVANAAPAIPSVASASDDGAADPQPLESNVAVDPQAFLDRLYAKSAAYLERDRYASIGDASEFYTKVVGVTFEGRQDVIGGLAPGLAVRLERDPRNPHDSNAIGVYFGALQLGFLRKEIARRLAEKFDAGERYRAEIGSVTGGGGRSFGVNLLVRRDRPRPERARPAGSSAHSRAGVLQALIGDRPLRDAQAAVIERVERGRNTLAILGTGRGKSLCFSYPAAVNALERGAKTVVLYPLRALANDQYEALVRRLEPLGLRVLRANGSIDSGERGALMDALETGAWDILCSTPEFFGFHLERFTERSRPALVVVDEAHHVFESKHRPAYGRIGEALVKLGSPQVLALTATAADEVFTRIVGQLGIDAWVIDPTVRTNLAMVDARNVTNKFAYIAARVQSGGKSIVYCNSRAEATKLAEKLRGTTGAAVAFYHAGVPTAERSEVERLFRADEIRVIVATSAFGEGIDLPDVRNVFLYHLNFDFTEFNQQSGRAGRDGEDAEIHLLFGEKDRRINDFIIERGAPTLYTLRALYRELRRLSAAATLRMTYVDIAATLDMDKVDAGTVGAAIRIFEDAGLVELGEDDDGRYVRFPEIAEKVDLTRNSRFAEGEAERESFARFCEVVISATPDVLESVINRPIYPSNVPLVR